MHEYFLETRGIYYRTNQWEPSRPTLVFVHGLSGSSSAWHAYEEHFKNSYNVLTFDLRGHGRSYRHKKYDAYKISHFVDDMHELLLHCEVEKFVLISHSFGTLVALEFLVRHEAMVTHAIFLSPSFAPGKSAGAKLIAPLLMLVPKLEILPQKRLEGTRIDYRKFPNTGDWNLRRMLADIPNTGLRVYLYCTRQSFCVDREDLLPHITIPVLIMHGKKDSIFPVKNSLIMQERIKGAELILIEHADHIIVLNNSHEVCAAIEHFIEASNKSRASHLCV